MSERGGHFSVRCSRAGVFLIGLDSISPLEEEQGMPVIGPVCYVMSYYRTSAQSAFLEVVLFPQCSSHVWFERRLKKIVVQVAENYKVR